MIVRYVRERREGTGGKDASLTLGESYIALAIHIEPKAGEQQIIIQRKSDHLSFGFHLKFFEIIHPRVPEDWVFVSLSSPGYYRLTPQEFTGDFWDWYHDGTKEEGEYARRILANVIIKIKRFHDRWDL